MILVTLGTGDKPFPRLLEAIEKEIKNGNIKDKVIVQAGTTKFESKYMEIFDLIPIDKFKDLINECDLLITHGGVGSITTGLKCNKKIIGVARLKKYGEVANDHQLQILENFDKEGLIMHLENLEDLSKKINESKNFKPKEYKSNTSNFIKQLEQEVDSCKKEKSSLKNIINVLFVSSIILFLFACTIKSIVMPKEILPNENRYASRYDKISLKSYLSNEMQDNFESTLSDQLIFSTKMKAANNLVDALMMKKYIDIITDVNNSYNYYQLGPVAVFGKENLVYTSNYSIKDYEGSLDKKISSLNNTMNLYPDVDYYFYYIEKDTDINFVDNSKLLVYEYLKDNLNSTNVSKFEINNFDEYKNYFYKTDHHWNYKGSYKGYLDVLDLLNIDNPKNPESEVCLKQKFSGSKANSLSKLVYYEDFCAYTFDYDDMQISVNGNPAEDYGFQDSCISGNCDLSYGGFYGPDDGEIIFDTNDKSKDNILIIGESYDNAILKLLAEKFNKTVSIDLRNYEHYMGEPFDYEDCLKKYDIDKVLFIGNINFWLSDEFDVIK